MKEEGEEDQEEEEALVFLFKLYYLASVCIKPMLNLTSDIKS